MSKRDTKKSKVEKKNEKDENNEDDNNEKINNEKINNEKINNGKNLFDVPSLIENDFLKLWGKIENDVNEIENSKIDNDEKFIKMRNYYVSLTTMEKYIKNLVNKMLLSFQELHQKNINVKSGNNDTNNVHLNESEEEIKAKEETESKAESEKEVKKPNKEEKKIEKKVIKKDKKKKSSSSSSELKDKKPKGKKSGNKN